MHLRRRIGLLAALVLSVGLIVPAGQQSAHADDPPFIPWSSLLPGLTDEYNPSSANDCVAGRMNCVRSLIREMERRFEPLGRSCNHNAMFALAYLRTTQTYLWAATQPGFFQETQWVNHEDAVFAKYYFDAYDKWLAGNRSQVPQAWLIAFDSAAARRTTGSADLLLGMSAHINRDLPFTLAAVGMVTPEGQNRKADHDKVDEFLNMVIEPVLAELVARFDRDTVNIETPFGVGHAGLFQLIAAWRERAWRNAELLVSAPTPELRAAAAQQIELTAAAEATTIVASNSYLPPITTTGPRDTFCASHNADPPPKPYAFGLASAY
ncbi:MAG TPA: DUF5995 family protein [Jiangellaceae bacterium]|nr:DUF5995 family protein [Jiangellaceae bacterium]